jgi:hypothetical protein
MDLNSILTTVIHTVVALAAVTLAPIVVKWAISHAKRIGLEVSAEQQARLEYLTRQAILKAEEIFTAKLRAGTGRDVTGADKLSFAIHDLQRTARVDSETAANLIHAELPKVGVGATSPGPVPFVTPAAETR